MLSDEVLNLAPDVAISVLTRQSEGELLTWIEEGTVQRAVVALRHLDADTAGRLIEEFPAKRRADVILPHGANGPAIDIITTKVLTLVRDLDRT